MAKIIRKGHKLEEEYYAIKQEQADKSAKNISIFYKVIFVVIMIYIASVTVSVTAGIFSIVFMPLTVCVGFILLIAVLAHFGDNISKHVNTDILISGMNGERIATKVLAALPDGYTVFQNLIVIYNNKESEIDNIVVGRRGVFIVEVKNHNGHIAGDLNAIYWTQHKVGRGGLCPRRTPVYNSSCRPSGSSIALPEKQPAIS